jgi:hypothetical protein
MCVVKANVGSTSRAEPLGARQCLLGSALPRACCASRHRRKPGGGAQAAATGTGGPGLLQKLGRVLKEKAAGELQRVFQGTEKTRAKLGVAARPSCAQAPGAWPHALAPPAPRSFTSRQAHAAVLPGKRGGEGEGGCRSGAASALLACTGRACASQLNTLERQQLHSRALTCARPAARRWWTSCSPTGRWRRARTRWRRSRRRSSCARPAPRPHPPARRRRRLRRVALRCLCSERARGTAGVGAASPAARVRAIGCAAAAHPRAEAAPGRWFARTSASWLAAGACSGTCSAG